MKKYAKKFDMSTIGGDDDGGALQSDYLNSADFARL